jgi:hypothetical protein
MAAPATFRTLVLRPPQDPFVHLAPSLRIASGADASYAATSRPLTFYLQKQRRGLPTCAFKRESPTKYDGAAFTLERGNQGKGLRSNKSHYLHHRHTRRFSDGRPPGR